MVKKTAFIAALLCIVAIVFIYVLHAGKQLENSAIGNLLSQDVRHNISHDIHNAFTEPIAVFIFQLILIIIASQVLGFIFKKIGQPSVMGEIVAGIMLGPSVVGSLFPLFSASVFPIQSLGNLQMLSQVGLILFMFVIGMELDFNIIKSKTAPAIAISLGSIVLPYTMGIILAYFLYKPHAPTNIQFYEFALFIGIAMSITAFPVLARIIRERNLNDTKLGTMAITSAAAGDILGWCLLAIVIAIVKAGNLKTGLFTLLAALLYVCFMLLVVRQLLKRVSMYKATNKMVKQSTIGIIFIVMLLSSYCAEVIGVHALFGAFLAGAVMPQEWNFRKLIIDKIEDVALVLLLPIFFVLTGLRTQIGLLNDISLWGTCLIIIVTAIIGKFAGSAIAAKLMGESVHDSLAIGVLMNTRGLMEIIILNIGYDLGILSPQIFTMMIIMALVTTFMTSPALNIIDKYFKY